jgi:thymidylate synthase (FAD)
MQTKLIWATPDADNVLAYIARVSNPENQENENIAGLLRYMLNNGHVSPFEMAHACVEINTTRDIGRQILRHRSFSFQEFSGRYQAYDKLPEAALRECRLQDTKNRQNSLETDDVDLDTEWRARQKAGLQNAQQNYEWALRHGIAKEQARAILPEGLTPSRIYMSGSLRSWIHYLTSRLDPSTQKEHRLIAAEVLELLRGVAPVTMQAVGL